MPHGRIVSGSGEDLEHGTVRYRTEDGSHFEVDAVPTETGYRYTNPRSVRPEQAE